MQPMVQIKHLSKKIGNKLIIDDLNFDIYHGEIFGFLGPNGAGKTTTIRMIVGLIEMTDGEVIIQGKNIRTDFEEAISKVGAIVENPEMYKFLTGYQNLVHYARMVKGIDQKRINEVVKLVGLEERIHEKVSTYSLGMRQRLGLAQALLHSPELLILDEPTNGLDPAGIRELRGYLKKLAHEQQMAILVSSHLLSEIEQMCDRVGIIKSGKLIETKAISEFVSNNGNTSVYYQVEPIDLARSYVKDKFPNKIIEEAADGMVLELNKDEIPELTKEFVLNGINIYSIKPAIKTLEDKFIEITGGESNA